MKCGVSHFLDVKCGDPKLVAEVTAVPCDLRIYCRSPVLRAVFLTWLGGSPVLRAVLLTWSGGSPVLRAVFLTWSGGSPVLRVVFLTWSEGFVGTPCGAPHLVRGVRRYSVPVLLTSHLNRTWLGRA